MALRARPRLACGAALGLLACTPWYGPDDPDANYEGSRCLVEAERLHCAHHQDTVWTGAGNLTPRTLLWQVPLGTPPVGGWPTVFLFQGTAHPAATFWDAEAGDDFGGFEQGLLTAALLDAGYAVLTPNARLSGTGAWETNIPPMATNWDSAGDHRFMLDLFDGIGQGRFGPLDPTRWYAAGISSGGYMSARMDLAYRDRFSALAIQSASWATCAGPVCSVPSPLDAEHLPTLFLHGDADIVVPIASMWPYHEGLVAAGVETEALVDEGGGHGWSSEAPEAIVAWFDAHP